MDEDDAGDPSKGIILKSLFPENESQDEKRFPYYVELQMLDYHKCVELVVMAIESFNKSL